MEIWSGMFIPDPDLDFLPTPDPGSRGQKGTGSATLLTRVIYCEKWWWVETWCFVSSRTIFKDRMPVPRIIRFNIAADERGRIRKFIRTLKKCKIPWSCIKWMHILIFVLCFKNLPFTGILFFFLITCLPIFLRVGSPYLRQLLTAGPEETTDAVSTVILLPDFPAEDFNLFLKLLCTGIYRSKHGYESG